MHLPNALVVAEDPDEGGFHNIIADILHVVLVDTPVLPPHAFNQLELKVPLEVVAFINP